MLLISHPRSGSDWFLRSLVGFTSTRSEIFSHVNDDPLQQSTFRGRSFSAKLMYLKFMQPHQVQKIHAAHIRDLSQTEARAPELVAHLRTRKDLYFIRRQNIRRSIMSGFIAAANGDNYHDDPADLITPAAMEYKVFFNLYTSHYLDMLWAESVFEYKEKFTFEGLLSGAEVPKTVQLDFTKSDTIKRDSYLMKHLVMNYDEVEQWMNDLKVPGYL